MSDRPFDDGRWPEDGTGHAECFLCGKPVDPLDPKRGTYEEPPAGPLLPIHLPCIDAIKPRPWLGLTLRKHVLSFEYARALKKMSERQFARAGLR